MTYASDGLAYGLPSHAIRALGVLEDAGFESWVVGGWVRDALLGAPSHDVDVTSAAHWKEARDAFQAAGIVVHETGTAHGTITAIIDDQPVEVTTFRVEGSYSDHRHPDEVRFVRDVREDLSRRDFTVNAMAYHPVRGLLDPFGGKEDLHAGVIRAVGDPDARFAEDALRVLRAVRFAARMGFTVEQRTHDALVKAAPGLVDIAQERIGQEMDGIVGSGKAGWALLEETEVMSAAIPELGAMVGFDQCTPFHAYDVLEHTAHVCRACEEFTAGKAAHALRWAALLHDIAKPFTFTVDSNKRGHFYGHPKVGAEMAETIMRRLSMPKELTARVRALIRLHDHRMHPTARSARRTLLKLERACPGSAEPLAFQLLDLKRADAVSKVWKYADYAIEVDELTRVIRREIHRKVPLRVTDLAINGQDVIDAMGIKPGPGVGAVLHELLVAVANAEVENDREALLSQL